MTGPYDSYKGDLLTRILSYIIENPGLSIYELLEELCIDYEIGYMIIGILDGQNKIIVQDDLYVYESWRQLKLYPKTSPGMNYCAICHQEKPFSEIWDLDHGHVCCSCMPIYDQWIKRQNKNRAITKEMNTFIKSAFKPKVLS